MSTDYKNIFQNDSDEPIVEDEDDSFAFDTAWSQPTKKRINRKDKKYRASLLDEAILKNREKGERLMGLDKLKLNRYATAHKLSTSLIDSCDLTETKIHTLRKQ